MLSAGDVGECIFKAGVRLALPLAHVVQRIAGVNYDLEEPAEQASEWVEDLCGHIATFRDRLAQASTLPEATVLQVRLLLHLLKQRQNTCGNQACCGALAAVLLGSLPSCGQHHAQVCWRDKSRAGMSY